MCERLPRRTRGFENHLEVFATGFRHSVAISSVFEKDRWYLRPRVRSGSFPVGVQHLVAQPPPSEGRSR